MADRRVRFQLLMVVSFAVAFYVLLVILGISTAFSVGLAEDVIGKHSVTESCISRKRVTKLHYDKLTPTIWLSVFIHHTGLLVSIALVH